MNLHQGTSRYIKARTVDTPSAILDVREGKNIKKLLCNKIKQRTYRNPEAHEVELELLLKELSGRGQRRPADVAVAEHGHQAQLADEAPVGEVVQQHVSVGLGRLED